MANDAVKRTMQKYDVRQWELALMLGISENTMYRKMRTELSLDEQKKLIDLIVSRKEKE